MFHSFNRSIRIDVRPEVVFDFTSNPSNMTTFAGYGPIPAIVGAYTIDTERTRVGSVRKVHNSDGSVHHEKVVLFKRPYAHVSRFSFSQFPASFLLRNIEEGWKFSPFGTGTKVTRTFRFHFSSILLFPLALLFVFCMKKAVERDLATVKATLEQKK